MILGTVAVLRARHADDVAVLHAELYEDVATRSRADCRPWRPLAAGRGHSPYEPAAPADGVAFFSVVERASGELAGEALQWGIDPHNRSAHLGVSLRPGSRGRGIGAEVVQLLCPYGFTVRGLHRLQVDTLADEAAVTSAATRAGFTPRAPCGAPPGCPGPSSTKWSSGCPWRSGSGRTTSRSEHWRP